ncbi:MAG: Ig-like domain-containing protein, partial [Actinomycetota bacterium]|nr:Ig-like domain-containing protein [Actinomycetota bacterium]
MSATRCTRGSKPLAFLVALATLFALAIPFGGIALANHPTGSTLEVSLETSENPTGTTHSLTATLFQGSTENPITTGCNPDCIIRFEVEGGPVVVVTQDDTTATTGQRQADTDASYATPDMTCRIQPGQSSCTVFFTSNAAGTNTIRAWHDEDRNPATTSEVDTAETRYAGGPLVPGKTYPTDCRDARGSAVRDPSCAPTTTFNEGVAEPDITDVVSKTWVGQAGNICVDAEPEADNNPSGTDHVITVRVTTGTLTNNTDTAGTFDCTGPAAQNVTVRLAVVDDDPNVFIVSSGGTATTGQPNTADATTNSAGETQFTVRCVDANCTGTNTFDASVPGAGGGSVNNPDRVAKTWFTAGQPLFLDATPERDTNEAGQTHTITCFVGDPTPTGVTGQNCDAQVMTGPNSTRDVDASATTPAGYIGQCFTGADGRCTITYSSNFTGTDLICVWRDANGNNLPDEADCQGGAFAGTEGIDDTSPQDDFSDVINKTWVTVGQGPSQVRLDMEPDQNPNTTDCPPPFDSNAAINQPQSVHEICAIAQSNTGTNTPTEITYRIVSGPGFFTNAAGTEQGGTTRTTQASGDATNPGNQVFLRSNTTGTTTIEACITGTNICTQGTKPWGVGDPSTARNINLTPETDVNRPGTLHEFTATVTDRNGNPVPGVAVTWTISGVGGFVNREGVTDANGTANATITSNNEGTSTVTVTIANDADPNQAGTQPSQCTQPAGTPPGATAGNCADTATKTWQGDPVDEPECSDGIDNDGDGEIDFPDDEGCESANDDDESDFPEQEFGGDVGEEVERGACRGLTTGSVQENPDGDGLVIVGTDGNDALQGSDDDDLICGLDGDDTINGAGGDDTIFGNGGKDGINGDDGADDIFGNAGKDIVIGGAGRDEIMGGRDNDNLSGGNGADILRGQNGWDTLKGNAGDDLIVAATGNDIIQGGSGDDVGRGGQGDDVLKGFTGSDTLRGGGDNDIIRGGADNDSLFGGSGDDILNGGAG